MTHIEFSAVEGKKSLLEIPNEVIACITVTRSLKEEQWNPKREKNSVQMQRLKRLVEDGHVLDHPGGTRADILALVNKMLYQTTIPMVCEKVVRLDKAEVITQTFYLRRVIEADENDKVRDRESNSIFNVNSEGDKKLSAVTRDREIKKEQGWDNGSSKALHNDNRSGRYISNADFLAVNGRDAVCASSPIRGQEAKVVSPDKVTESTCKKSYAKNGSIENPVLDDVVTSDGRAPKDMEENPNGSEVKRLMKKDPVPSSRSRASLPENFPRLPPGLKADPEIERCRLEGLFAIEKRRLEECKESGSKNKAKKTD